MNRKLVLCRKRPKIGEAVVWRCNNTRRCAVGRHAHKEGGCYRGIVSSIEKNDPYPVESPFYFLYMVDLVGRAHCCGAPWAPERAARTVYWNTVHRRMLKVEDGKTRSWTKEELEGLCGPTPAPRRRRRAVAVGEGFARIEEIDDEPE